MIPKATARTVPPEMYMAIREHIQASADLREIQVRLSSDPADLLNEIRALRLHDFLLTQTLAKKLASGVMLATARRDAVAAVGEILKRDLADGNSQERLIANELYPVVLGRFAP